MYHSHHSVKPTFDGNIFYSKKSKTTYSEWKPY